MIELMSDWDVFGVFITAAIMMVFSVVGLMVLQYYGVLGNVMIILRLVLWGE